MQPEVRIKRILFKKVAGFLVYTDQAVILVDTGYKGMSDNIVKALESIRRKPEDLGLILLTHTHYDHAGGAAELKKLSGAAVAVHEAEAEHLRNGRTTIPNGTRWKGKLMVWIARRFVKRVTMLDSLEPDILIGERMDLKDFGIPGYTLHTPGHSSGSISVVLENKAAIVGDNFLGMQGDDHFPPLANDRDAVLESWQKLIETGSEKLFPAHGSMIKMDEIKKELTSATARYSN